MKRFGIIIICLCGTLFSSVKAQDYLYEGGVAAGVSSAYGDINQGKFFYNPGVAFEATFRYNRNLRWAFLGEFLTAGLRGDSRDFENVFPGDAQLSFSSRLWQAGASAEFNFLNYGWGYDYRNTSRISLFLSLGIGIGAVSGNRETAFSFSLPMGAGLKYKFAPRWNAVLKVTFAKMLTDKSDGIEDPYPIESSGWKNTDWYSTCTVGVTYEFGIRKRKCNNLE